MLLYLYNDDEVANEDKDGVIHWNKSSYGILLVEGSLLVDDIGKQPRTTILLASNGFATWQTSIAPPNV